MKPGLPSRLVAAALFSVVAVSGSLAAIAPPGFVVEDAFPDAAFNRPTAMAFLPDGRVLVAEKRGWLRIIVDGVKLQTPAWNGETEVLIKGDRGLIGLAVDPEFESTRFVYLLYTVDPDSDGVDNNGNAFGRLTRYRMSDTDTNRVDPASRTVLIGETWATGIPSCSSSHGVGALRWGADGSLLLTSGDGASYSYPDAGGHDSLAFAPGHLDTLQDIGSFRAQYLGSMAGKVLRVHPETGHGYASNPYYDGDARSIRSKIWAYGMRNPFRLCVIPGTGSPDPAEGRPGAIALFDVGWNEWEEINVARGGENFGWPSYEGPEIQHRFDGSVPAHCGFGSWGSYDNPAWPEVADIAWHHSDPERSAPPGSIGSCVTGGVCYQGTSYPLPYRNSLFFGDLSGDWLKVAVLGDSQEVLAVRGFASEAGGAVDFALDPATGDVFYVTYYTGQILRIRYEPTLSVGGAEAAFALSNPYPNPCQRGTSLSLELPAASQVTWSVLDLLGRRVWEEPRCELGAGRQTLRWQGRGSNGRRMAPGLYLARVEVEGRALTRRIVVAR